MVKNLVGQYLSVTVEGRQKYLAVHTPGNNKPKEDCGVLNGDRDTIDTQIVAGVSLRTIAAQFRTHGALKSALCPLLYILLYSYHSTARDRGKKCAKVMALAPVNTCILRFAL
jgi:hypothetical protein